MISKLCSQLCAIVLLAYPAIAETQSDSSDIASANLKADGVKVFRKIETYSIAGGTHVILEAGPTATIEAQIGDHAWKVQFRWTWEPTKNPFGGSFQGTLYDRERLWQKLKNQPECWNVDVSKHYNGNISGNSLFSSAPFTSLNKEGDFRYSLLTFRQLISKLPEWTEIAKKNNVGLFKKTMAEATSSGGGGGWRGGDGATTSSVEFWADTSDKRSTSHIDYSGITVTPSDVPVLLFLLDALEPTRQLVVTETDKIFTAALLKQHRTDAEEKQKDDLFK